VAEHPIQAPQELICELQASVQGDPCPVEDATFCITSIATRAAQWGADQELEACVEFLRKRGVMLSIIEQLRAARRPKPPSLKEQALEILKKHVDRAQYLSDEAKADADTLRRAIEALPDE
jgi:hypothetical protein